MKKFLLLFVFAMLSCSLNVNANVQEKAIWQDPNNVVIVWENDENCEYKIYRSIKQDGEGVRTISWIG